jgi:hypothetical protein
MDIYNYIYIVISPPPTPGCPTATISKAYTFELVAVGQAGGGGGGGGDISLYLYIKIYQEKRLLFICDTCMYIQRGQRGWGGRGRRMPAVGRAKMVEGMDGACRLRLRNWTVWVGDGARS